MSAAVSRTVPSRGGTRSSHRKQNVLDVDLNVPIVENHDEGTSTLPSIPETPAAQVVPPQVVPIDVESFDDDVLISSPRAFAEAKSKSRRNSETRVVDVEAEGSSSYTCNRNKRRRVRGNQQVINCESYVNLECESCSSRPEQQQAPPPPPPPPPEPKFTCPVCMGPVVEEMTTKCGHIFCKACIKAAITAQKKCPTCRRKITMKDTFRVYLPSAS